MLLAASIIHVYKLQSLKRYISQITAWAPLVGRLPFHPKLLSTDHSCSQRHPPYHHPRLASSPTPAPPSSPPPSTWLRKVSDLILLYVMLSLLFCSVLLLACAICGHEMKQSRSSRGTCGGGGGVCLCRGEDCYCCHHRGACTGGGASA